MPTYEYRCTTCGFEFEEFQSIAAEPLSKCPRCGAQVQRKISGGNILIFKGSGFYINDYKKSGSETSSSSAKAEPKSTDSEKSKKTEN